MMNVFEQRHPYVLSDGRRFASLRCAALSAVDVAKGGQGKLTVDFRGQVTSFEELLHIANGYPTLGGESGLRYN